jgi:hypothetical protein
MSSGASASAGFPPSARDRTLPTYKRVVRCPSSERTYEEFKVYM